MAPISRPCSQCRSSTQAENIPTSPAVATTPKVARLIDGQSATRNVSRRVRMPPSKMMTARAKVPIT
jgi:hypothetical protein